ncbi:MAG: hypothetical protein WC558_09700 [Patulibacter sp.]
MTEASSRPTRSPRPARRPSAATARRRRLAAIGGGLALLLVAVVVVLLVRGGGADDARSVVARGFASGDELKTAQVNIKLGLTGSAAAGDEPVLLELAGPYAAGDAETAKFRFAVNVNGTGAEPVATLTGIGGRNYVSVGKQHYVLSQDALDGLKSEDSKDDEPLSLDALGIDPESWLQDPELIGDEQWDGKPVTHVRSKVDVKRMTDDLKKVVGRAESSDDVSDEAKAAANTLGSIEQDVSAATMDVWVGEGEGALRRLQVDIRLKQGRLALDFGLTKINAPVRISAPKNARPFDELLSVFAAAAGERGATGTTTEPSAPSAPSGTTTSEAAPSGDAGAYAECVQAAGSDVTKLQACADLQN